MNPIHTSISNFPKIHFNCFLLLFRKNPFKSSSPMPCVTVRNMLDFYGGELLALRSTPKMEDHPLSAVRDCLFNIFAATLRIWRPSPPYPQYIPTLSRVVGTLIVAQLVKKVTTFYGIRRFITMTTRARHWSLPPSQMHVLTN
jgi:hypothetical protein